MKKTLFFLFVPFVAFAICQECDSFRSSLLTRNQDITAEVRGMQGDFSNIVFWSASLSNSLSDSGDKGLADSIYTQASIGQARSAIALEMLASNRVEILAFNCDCSSSSSGCECAGVLTNMYDSLLNIEVYARETSYGMETLLHDLETFKTAVVGGFVNVSNQLNEVVSSIDSIVTNRYYINWRSNRGGPASWTTLDYRFLDLNGVKGTIRGRYFNSSGEYYSVSDFMGVVGTYLLPSVYYINNHLWEFYENRFPILTNTVRTLTLETTNFFSFFRSEIGVHGVLEDWTAQDGSYYDFLTNHYIQVVTGGTLSGNQSSKTNWFSRIETLLAALVFGDEGTTTNTVDSSMGDELKSQISSSFNQLIDGPQNGMMQDLEEITPSVIEQVRRFSSVFSSASMPSNITLFSQDGENGFKIAFEISNDSVYYDIFRNITTLCWSLVGLFFVYRFLVWSITKIVVLVQFCFNVFTDIFKAR